MTKIADVEFELARRRIHGLVDALCELEHRDAISKWRGHRIRAGIIRAKAHREAVIAALTWWRGWPR